MFHDETFPFEFAGKIGDGGGLAKEAAPKL
jgi:hypothetical protein